MTFTKQILLGLSASIVTSFALSHAALADGELNVVGSGGIVGEMNTKYFGDPFTAETGIKINRISGEQNLVTQLEAMVGANSVSWDVMELSGENYPRAVDRSLLEPIDYSIVDPNNELPGKARGEFGTVAASYAHMMAVRTDQMPEGKTMSSWADFWDVETFPGPRGLRNSADDNLEFALLADGVAPEDIYTVLMTPEGIDRAFAKLDEIKPHIDVWWTSGAQSIQTLIEGEVYFTTSYNGRISALMFDGQSVSHQWAGGALHLSYIGVPKGAPNIEAAMKYIRKRAADAEAMRAYAQELPYPGFAPGLFDGVPPEIASHMPTDEANASVMFVGDPNFWAKHGDPIFDRWEEWLLE